ncbi:restriction endonuclease subunit S [Citrobacter amalonaticus]|uniref:restriction endonuclease subunit S n=1 Tax=Citrobacter amalonaticus TaxID=35703 RepID=UPI0021609699|nr:restriction endonuclease subunit S [Citrobacter amalonaticus]
MNWPMVKLGDVLSIIRGITFKPNDQVEPMTEGSTIVMRTKNVQRSGLDISDLIAIPDSFIKRDEQYLRTEDMLISSANSWELVGKISFIEKLPAISTAGGFISIIRAKKEKVIPKYLYYWLTLEHTQVKIRNCGQKTTNISNLNLERFKELLIPLPSLNDQRRIVAILDKAAGIRQKRKQAIKVANDYLYSIFLDMFGDPVMNPKGFEIKVLSEFFIDEKNGTKCGPFGSALKKDEYTREGVPVWNMDNITLKGDFIDSPSLWVSEYKYQELESYSVLDGDVIISRAGTVGKMGVVRSSTEKSIISTNLIRVRFNEKLYPEYFVSLMIYCKGRVGNLKTGPDGTFTHMNTGVLSNLEFPYPPLELQKKYIKIRQSVMLIIDKYHHFGFEIDDTFCAINQKAFLCQP